MAKRLIPLLDRILVQKLEAPTKSVGGVLLPDTASKVRAKLAFACGSCSVPSSSMYNVQRITDTELLQGEVPMIH